ncbi:Uncharacterized conserved protein [Nitrosomonas eutropha]|uniref:CRISPR system precrRNA processing endoribonuclease RAMP protein Cas6 n=1 Tax=Nitrosomonas eutropha TaxID=916 RepID=UPI00088031EF|nr:CRISPR system precrRNA processing endoribonuclease RAMP protein Cas6 [Nitrosomonas eutropha]SCX27257.1 Uncharacterized conserved protein [Nitrosomonas eutropha]
MNTHYLTEPASPVLSLGRYRLDWRVTRSIRLPDYAGSMLRGAFGHALRSIGCITCEKNCATCPLRQDCPYTTLFEPIPPKHHPLQDFSRIPVPYIIEPPEWGARVLHPGDTLTFHFTLVGRAVEELPIAILAWRRALARGIGSSNGQAELMGIWLEQPESSLTIYTPENGSIQKHDTRLVCPPLPGDSVRLHLVTPLRLQNNGVPLKAQTITERALLMALVRRLALMSEFHGELAWQPDFHHLGELASSIQGNRQLSWRDWKRYSSRQQQEMALGGVTGRWNLHGKLSAFWPALWFGQWLHAGKNASFGLGHYQICVA